MDQVNENMGSSLIQKCRRYKTCKSSSEKTYKHSGDKLLKDCYKQDGIFTHEPNKCCRGDEHSRDNYKNHTNTKCTKDLNQSMNMNKDIQYNYCETDHKSYSKGDRRHAALYNEIKQEEPCTQSKNEYSGAANNNNTGNGDTSCFAKFTCCHIKRKNKNKQFKRSSFDALFYDESKKTSQSVCDSYSGTNSIQTASSCLTSLISETSVSNHSQDIFLNISKDSQVEERPCLLKMIYTDHKCNKNPDVCLKKHLTLNLHLKTLMSFMPKSYSDSEAIDHELSNCTGVKRDPLLSRRRNAVCETSLDMRLKFCDALSSYLTLKAMAKYDFI